MPYKAAAGIVKQIVDDEALLLDSGGQQIHHLNQTALVLWECCEVGSTIDNIVSNFIQMYGVDEETVRRDVVHTLSSWVELGLVTNIPD